MTTVDEYFRLFERYRGFRPNAMVQTDACGITHIRIPGFAEVIISSTGGCDMPAVKSYPEGTDYAPAAALGWPAGRGEPRKIACIFADFYGTRKRGEKPPYFSFTPEQYLARDTRPTASNVITGAGVGTATVEARKPVLIDSSNETATELNPPGEERIRVAARSLSPYFDADGQQRALEAYAKFAFAPERDWRIGDKMTLYDASRRAFDPAVPEGEALSAFSKIYEDLFRPVRAGGWGVGRNSSGLCWPAAKTFETIKTEFPLFRWHGPITLLNFQRSGDHGVMLSSLEKLRGLKPVANYPVMVVSKFLHFYNPELFPIYDYEVIWNGVFRRFRRDFKEFCYTSGLKYEYEDTASFYCKYILWASSLLAHAHPDFIAVFISWLRKQPGSALETRTFDASTLYATAFEFTAIGAWRKEISAVV